MAKIRPPGKRILTKKKDGEDQRLIFGKNPRRKKKEQKKVCHLFTRSFRSKSKRIRSDGNCHFFGILVIYIMKSSIVVQ